MRVPVSLALLVPLTAGVLVPTATADAPGARERLEAAAAALAEVPSYRIALTERGSGPTITIRGAVSRSRADVSIRVGEVGGFRVRQIASRTYFRAGARFWREAGGNDGTELAERLGGRWIRVARADAEPFTSLVLEVLPVKIAACLIADGATGSLSVGRTGTVGGRRAIALQDAGDRPGTSPSVIWLAADGAPLPLLVRQTGPVRAGGEDTACTSASDGSEEAMRSRSTVRFSDHGARITFRAPRNPIVAPASSADGAATARALVR